MLRVAGCFGRRQKREVGWTHTLSPGCCPEGLRQTTWSEGEFALRRCSAPLGSSAQTPAPQPPGDTDMIDTQLSRPVSPDESLPILQPSSYQQRCCPDDGETPALAAQCCGVNRVRGWKRRGHHGGATVCRRAVSRTSDVSSDLSAVSHFRLGRTRPRADRHADRWRDCTGVPQRHRCS